MLTCPRPRAILLMKLPCALLILTRPSLLPCSHPYGAWDSRGSRGRIPPSFAPSTTVLVSQYLLTPHIQSLEVAYHLIVLSFQDPHPLARVKFLCLRNCQSISLFSLRLNLLDTFPCGEQAPPNCRPDQPAHCLDLLGLAATFSVLQYSTSFTVFGWSVYCYTL